MFHSYTVNESYDQAQRAGKIQRNLVTFNPGSDQKSAEVVQDTEVDDSMRRQADEIRICTESTYKNSPNVHPKRLRFDTNSGYKHTGLDSVYTGSTYDNRQDIEQLSTYAMRLKKYKDENETLRQMLSVNSFEINPSRKSQDREPIPSKYVEQETSQLSTSNYDIGKRKPSVLFDDTQRTMFDNSIIDTSSGDASILYNNIKAKVYSGNLRHLGILDCVYRFCTHKNLIWLQIISTS